MKPPVTDFRLTRNPFGRLVYIGSDGFTQVGVVPVRAFPLSAPDAGFALLASDGRELRWIENLADLPANERELIIEELAEREFMPVISRIVAVGSYAMPSIWQVDTDRGATELILKSEDDIRRLRGSNALLLADSNGIHYLIRDRDALDAPSRKILKRFL